MTDTPPVPKRPAPLSVRLTPEKREQLVHDAAGMSVNAYVISCLFDRDRPQQHRGIDRNAMAALTAKLGQSRIANNLNQLARAANSGSLVLTPDIEADLTEACRFVAEIRSLLIHALGLADGGS